MPKIARLSNCPTQMVVWIVMEIINTHLIWRPKMSLSTLCTNTFRKTDAYFSPFGATANGFAVHVIMSMTATTITEVSINFDPILETLRLKQYFQVRAVLLSFSFRWCRKFPSLGQGMERWNGCVMWRYVVNWYWSILICSAEKYNCII